MLSGVRVLVVDDDDGIRVTLEASLDLHQVTCVSSASEAIELLAREDYEVVICDLMMPGMTGAELFESLPTDSPLRERFLFVTGGSLPISVRAFLALSAPPVLTKPFTISQVRNLVASILARRLA